ncbi:MAG TPA: flavin reductase family protein [Anaerolineales bacterium]|nr:flavin reductase family protein [Anaerolineales bacterium]
MDIAADALPWSTVYKLLIGAVVPRPIGWISTLDEGGRRNLAPFSFFNAVSAKPPHVVFSPMIRETDAGVKDTLANLRATGEFVVNIVTEALAQAMNITSTEFPADVDEFEAAGLTAAPSRIVRPPRVAESPVHFECRVAHLLELGDGPGGSTLVVGRVVHVHVDPSVLLDGDKIDLDRLRPIGRLSGAAYCRVTDRFEMKRPPSQIARKVPG